MPQRLTLITAIIERLLRITIEEPKKQEKERLKDLTKAKIIEHYIREKVELDLFDDGNMY